MKLGMAIPGLYSDSDILSARQCVLNLSKDEMDQNKAYQYGRKETYSAYTVFH